MNKLGAGAGDEVKLQWSVLRATKARLTAKLLTPRKAPPEPGATHGQIGNLALAQGGLALALDEHGSGSGVVTIHPGPTGTTTYALEVTTAAGKKSLTTKVEVANFNLQLLLPDGAGQGGLDCVLEVPGLPPFKGQTRVDGVLWLSLPNLAAPSAKLRMLDGSREIARWMLQLVPEAGLKEVPAGKGKPAAGSVRIALGTKAGPLRAAPSPHDAGHPKLVALRMLHARYLSVLDENAAWMREQAAKKFVAEWCDALVHEKKSAAWIDRGRLEEFKQAFAAESLARQLTLDVAGRALTSQLDDPELIEVLNDLGYRGACERSVSVQGLGESLAGSAWIERELEKESTGFLHLIANAYTVQGATELSDQVDLFKKRNFDTVEPWADALAEFAGTFTRVHGEDTVEEAAKVIGRRFGMPASELIGLEHLLTAQGARGALLVERRVMVLEVSKVAVAGKAAKKVIEGLAKVATVINIATKVNLVFKDPKLQNLLGTGAALLELLGAFSERFNEGANRLFRALMRTGRQVDIEGLPKAAELVTLRVGEAEGGLVLRTLAEKADAIAALSGLIDAVTGTLDAIEDYKKGDMAGALGKVAVAAGGAMVALAGTLFTLSATSAELPPLAGILFIMGTLIGLVGILIGSAYGASEMELWARHSAFGINARGHELEEQIRELNDLLYTVRIQGILQWKRSDEGSLALKIEPALLSELSKVRLKIVLKAAGQKDWPLLDALLVDRPTLEQEDTRLLQADFAYAEKEGALPGFEHPLPIRSIGLRTRTPLSSHEWSAAEVTLTIDPDGSGAGLKRSATIGTGLGEWVKLHEAT